MHAALPPTDKDAAGARTEAGYREVRFRHSRDFATIVADSHASLLISTYQAGKLVLVGTGDAGLTISLHNFEQAMGIAVNRHRLAVGSRGVVWLLHNDAGLAPRFEPPGRYDACFLARQSCITGNIHGHEMAWVGDELWLVNTLFSCLCTLHPEFSFVPRWQPPFITEMAANDRCHLNGMALADGHPAYVTVMAESNEPAGWRPNKSHTGCLLDVASGQAVTRGLAMPHSPRVHDGRLWVLNSGLGSLEIVDPRSGQRQVVERVPGYTRGLAFCGPYAFIGMSRIRETAVFGGVPIAERRDELRCGVAVVDLRSGVSVAYLEFETGVEEIFDVQVLPATRCIALTGPYPVQDDARDVWVVPPPGRVPTSPHGSSMAAAEGPGRTAANASDAEVASLVRSGLLQHAEGRFAEAVNTLQAAVAARSESAELHNHLGNAWQDYGRQELARASYERALAVQENFVPAHQNLGYLLINFGLTELGLAHLRRAEQLRPSPVNRVMLATALPVIYASCDEVAERRRQLEDGLRRLAARGETVDTTHTPVPTNFLAAYQGQNDREVQRLLGRIYRAPEFEPRPRPRGSRLRVGFLSAHFRDHTIGRLNFGRVALIDRERFEVTVLSVGRHQDAMAQEFQRCADHYLALSGPLDSIRRQIVELGLDLLLFADVGMNALTYALSFSRMAPVQCVTWGHPVTTGSPAMDYFVSSRLLETGEAHEHYTECLVQLSNLGTYYHRPRIDGPPLGRTSLGLDPAANLYLCTQTLFKIHPEFDAILAGILRRDPRGELVLIEGRQSHWTRLLRERFARTLGDVASRVRLIPPQANPEFLRLNAGADVLLDTIHFGGGNTSYEAFAAGTPVVTLPGQFLRSRITSALYQKMQVTDCLVDSPDAYVDEAVRLGTQRDYRQFIRNKIDEASHVLFDDLEGVREFERFLVWAGGDRSEPWS